MLKGGCLTEAVLGLLELVMVRMVKVFNVFAELRADISCRLVFRAVANDRIVSPSLTYSGEL